jgi:hypothetical protein
MVLNWNKCNIVAPTFVWSDLFTANMLTFWVGSNTCTYKSVPKRMRIHANDDQYFSALSQDGFLTLHCDQKDSFYTVFPDDRLFTWEQKMNYQKTLLSNLQEIPYTLLSNLQKIPYRGKPHEI